MSLTSMEKSQIRCPFSINNFLSCSCKQLELNTVDHTWKKTWEQEGDILGSRDSVGEGRVSQDNKE